MSKFGTIAVVAAGGTVLAALAYAGVTVAKGASLRDVPPLSWLAHPPPPAAPHADAAPHAAPAPAAPHELRPHVPPMTAGVLGAFVLPSPFDSRELQALQAELVSRRTAVEAAEKENARRASELDEWQKTLEERARELTELRARVEPDAAAEPPVPAGGAQAAPPEDAASWRAMATLFEEGDAEELAGKLAEFAPEEAAQILKGLEPDRVAALLNALPKAQYKAFFDAWRLARD
jgi:type IV secretory pathway VirB10-like protein